MMMLIQSFLRVVVTLLAPVVSPHPKILFFFLTDEPFYPESTRLISLRFPSAGETGVNSAGGESRAGQGHSRGQIQ